MSKVTLIPATVQKHTRLPLVSASKRRVAGYARVSTDSDEQFTSYEAQVDYYTHYIQSKPEWEFVKVYTDEGISGLSTKKREGFNEMIEDALMGKIDLIITKSVSRFARNTVDSLTTIRKLKDAGCECYFEKENIYTFDGKGELLLTIMSSLAQEESRSISENVTWGQRKRFADGKVSMPYKHFLGYEKGEDNRPRVVREEAETVRLIYSLFLSGKTPLGICKVLNANAIPTPAGKEKWNQSTIISILRNEKYKGDALLQKQFTVDYLSKKRKLNEGEVTQYYVEGSHEAIIDSDEWDMVQLEMVRRKKLGRSYSGSSIFSGKLICADCGGSYGHKTWHSSDKYRRQVWQCNGKFKGDVKCRTPTLDTQTIQERFMAAFNQAFADKADIEEGIKLLRKELTDCTELDYRISQLKAETEVISGLVQNCINEKASKDVTQDEFEARYNSLAARYEAISAELKSLSEERERRLNRDQELRLFLKELDAQGKVMAEWNERTWIALLEEATVRVDGKIEFTFKGGTRVLI